MFLRLLKFMMFSGRGTVSYEPREERARPHRGFAMLHILGNSLLAEAQFTANNSNQDLGGEEGECQACPTQEYPSRRSKGDGPVSRSRAGRT